MVYRDDPVEPGAPARFPQGRGGWAAVVVGVVAAFAAGFLLGGFTSERLVTRAGATTTTTPLPLAGSGTTTTTTRPTTTTTIPSNIVTTALGTIQWLRTDDLPDGLEFGHQSIATTSNAFVAADPERVWTSNDGHRWFAAPAPTAGGGWNEAAVHAFGDRLVLWATRYSEESGSTQQLWTSDDGLTWTAVELGTPELPATTGADYRMESWRVVPTPTRLFVSGGVRSIIPWDDILGESIDWSEWLDGIRQLRLYNAERTVAFLAATTTSENGRVRIELRHAPDGDLVHVVSVDTDEDAAVVEERILGGNWPVIWTFDPTVADGPPTASYLPFTEYANLIPVPTGLVAVRGGWDEDGRPIEQSAAITHDGVGWETIDTVPFPPGSWIMSADATASRGVVALSGPGNGIEAATAQLWTTTDGYAWERLTAFPEGEAYVQITGSQSGWVLLAMLYGDTGNPTETFLGTSIDGVSWEFAQAVDIFSVADLQTSSSPQSELHLWLNSVVIAPSNLLLVTGQADTNFGGHALDVLWVGTIR